MPRSYSGLALGRILQILSLVYSNPGRLRAKDIAASIGVCERQVTRYITAIREGGIDIRPERNGYEIKKGSLPFRIDLTLNEALGLLLCRETTSGAGRQPFEASIDSAFSKITGMLPDRLRALVDSNPVTHIGGAKRDYSGSPWGAIVDAITKQNVLEMVYFTQSSGTKSTRSVDPYAIVWLSGYCHLIAYCHFRKGLRDFSLDCIESAKPTGERFERLKSFSLAEHLKNAGPNAGEPVNIAVRFAALVSDNARRRAWDFEHKFTPEPDGALTMTATVRGLKDIRRELLSWGRHVEVISPPELRQTMLEEAKAMVGVYD